MFPEINLQGQLEDVYRKLVFNITKSDEPIGERVSSTELLNRIFEIATKIPLEKEVYQELKSSLDSIVPIASYNGSLLNAVKRVVEKKLFFNKQDQLSSPPDENWFQIANAIERNQKQKVRAILRNLSKGERDKLLNQMMNETHSTLLFLAIEKDNFEMIRILFEYGADLNRPGFNNMPPILFAIFNNKKKLASLFAKLDPEIVNRPIKMDGYEYTPLTFSTCTENREMIHFLVKHLNARINDVIPGTYYSPLTLALISDNTAMIQFLVELGANRDFAQSLFNAKMIAQVWGLEGTEMIVHPVGTIQFNLEEFSGTVAQKLLLTLLFQFNEENPSSANTDQLLETFDLSLQNLSKEELLERVHTDKPVVIFKSVEEHQFGLVVFKNQLYVCDRQPGSPLPGVRIYNLQDKSIEELFNELESPFKSMNEFNAWITSLNLPLIGNLPQKEQTVSNCSWANTKSVVLALLYAFNEPNFQERYKEFTSFARMRVLQRYLESTTVRMPGVLAKVWRKAKEKGLETQELKSLFLRANQSQRRMAISESPPRGWRRFWPFRRNKTSRIKS